MPFRMTQLVTRLDEGLLAEVDELVGLGVVASRSDAVRKALVHLVESTRRARTGEAIVAGYRQQPQGEQEMGWADEATIQMIAEEPW